MTNNSLIFINKIGEKGTPSDILYVNDTVCKRLGYSFNEMISLQPTDVGMPINSNNLKDKIKKLYAGGMVCYPMLFFAKSNQVLLTNIEASLTTYNGNKAVLTVAKEIYEHNFIKNIVIKYNKDLESSMMQIEETKEQLFQQEKLATIGQMAAGIAHEINNPLGYISSNIETAYTYFNKLEYLLNSCEQLFSNLSSLSDNELDNKLIQISELKNKINLDFILSDVKELFEDIEDGLKKISEIVNNLKTFSRLDPSLEFKIYDLNKGIKNSLIIARNEIKYYARVVESLGNIPVIMANGNRINEVLLNIILNSCYAIKNKNSNEKGIIKITTYVENEYVVCEIEDNGTGIKKENINKIFDPFFTTKPVGSGTGLGLSIAYDIITNKHNGKIYAESIPEIGTRITFKLPIQLK